MADPETLHPDDERADGTVSRRKPEGRADLGVRGADPPTVRTGSSVTPVPAGSASGSGVATGGAVVPGLAGSTGSVRTKSVEPPLPEPGDRIGEFELREAIGAGGMGAVFRAFDTTLERTVALKILPPEQAIDTEVVQRFYQEARAAARLDHENIARVHTIGHDLSYHYIAFEFIDGTTVRQRVESQGPLPVGEAINYTLQIAGALVHSALRGVVHRDIKPSNIIVTSQGRAKLVDMGLARRFERHRDDGLTQSGMTLGTFDYISPEQARDPRDVDVRSDLYSLGCTLYHMLTGRPPFPEGTVLQKLLQHQEETAPDVRTLNGAVPDDLAAILAKLMAKDRDRRYQTPEHLVRDLLTLAGALGLRSVSSEGLVWMSASVTPAWQRHLVWAVPVLGLFLVVGILIWWGQEPVVEDQGGEAIAGPVVGSGSGSGVGSAAAQTQVKSAGVVGSNVAKSASAGGDPEATRRSASSGGRGSSTLEPVGMTTEIVVKSSEDLVKIIESSPPRSTIVLADDGPYVVALEAVESRSGLGKVVGIRVLNRELTLRAAAGARPVVTNSRAVASPGLEKSSTERKSAAEGALLELRDGRVTIEGIVFRIDVANSDSPICALLCDGSDLVVRRSEFRGVGASRGKTAAIRVVGRPNATAPRPPPIRIEASHIDCDPIAIRAQGPFDLSMTDCTISASESAFWVDDAAPDALPGAPAWVRLAHVSILAGDGPVFRLNQTAATLRVDDSVVAPSPDSFATLVASDIADSVDWFGRANLYGKIRTYLQITNPQTARVESVDTFAAWENRGSLIRESGSLASEEGVWRAIDPRFSLRLGDPSQAFVLASAVRLMTDAGARRGLFGPLVQAPRNATKTSETAKPGRSSKEDSRKSVALTRTGSEGKKEGERSSVVGDPPVKPTRREKTENDREVASLSPAAPVQPPLPLESSSADLSRGSTAESVLVKETGPASNSNRSTDDGSSMPPTMPPPMPQPGGLDTGSGEREATTTSAPTRTDPPIPSTKPARDEPIRTLDQFLSAFRGLGARGGLLRIAAEADFELPPIEIIASARCRIVAEPSAGGSRPRLRFRPPRSDPEQPVSRSALFVLRQGASLVLTGVDIVLHKERMPVGGRWSAFAVRDGTDLEITRCTVTLEGEAPRSALVFVRPGDDGIDPGFGPGAGASLAARVRIEDSLLRGGGDLIDVSQTRPADIEIANSLVSVQGALLRGHAAPQDSTAEPIHLILRQVTTLASGGLIALESNADEKNLPRTDIVVRDSILASLAPETPLVRVDGQEPVDPFADPVRWEGHSVAYHDVRTYRRDSSARGGDAPKLYNQPEWETTVGPREDDAIHGDLKFQKDWPPTRPLWSLTRDDARLAPESPAQNNGADLDRIPEGPTGS